MFHTSPNFTEYVPSLSSDARDSDTAVALLFALSPASFPVRLNLPRTPSLAPSSVSFL